MIARLVALIAAIAATVLALLPAAAESSKAGRFTRNGREARGARMAFVRTQVRVQQIAVKRLIQATNTAPPPLQPPRLLVLHRSALDTPGYIFVAPKPTTPGQQQGPEIVDDRGRPVWFEPISNGEEADDFRVQSYGGKPVLTWWQGTNFGGVSQGVDYIANSSYHLIATVHAGNGLNADGHEFLLTPQGTALITSYHEVPYDLSSVGGPKDGQVVDGVAQEIDLATGHVLFEWHSLDHVPISDSYLPLQSPYDYFHINAVNIDNDGNLLISGRGTWTVYKVNRHSGQILWRLGGKRSDFVLGPGAAFTGQHNPIAAGENTIRLFDNGNDATTTVRSDSRVIWIHLDPQAKTATLSKAIEHSQHPYAQSQGNAQALTNENTFVGWGSYGRISEFDPQGNLLFDASVPGGSYRGYRFEWNGQPDAPPIATAHRSGRRRTTVHAIWNGATAVARWRILAGTTAAKLVPARTVRWNGLDTTVKIVGLPKVVEVAALDSGGRLIGTSKAVRVH